MKKTFVSLGAIAIFLAIAPAALASEYYIKIAGVEGETSEAIDIQSWSWGASNAGAAQDAQHIAAPRDAASGLPTGKRMHKPMSMTPSGDADGDASAEAVIAQEAAQASSADHAAVDQDCDGVCDDAAGQADLSSAATQDEIHGFSLTLPASAAARAGLCAAGKHIAKATIVARSDGTETPLEDVTVQSCSAVAANPETAGETPEAYSKVALTGTMKHTKTGHVTLMK